MWETEYCDLYLFQVQTALFTMYNAWLLFLIMNKFTVNNKLLNRLKCVRVITQLSLHTHSEKKEQTRGFFWLAHAISFLKLVQEILTGGDDLYMIFKYIHISHLKNA